MKRIIAMLLLSSWSMAMANNCPQIISEIDARLGSAQGLNEDERRKIKELRDDGERLHEQGKHAESMQALEQARSMLGS